MGPLHFQIKVSARGIQTRLVHGSSGLSTIELPPVTLCDTCTPEQLAALKQYPSNAAPVLVGYANQYDRVREESHRIDKRI
jgi:hypothetical protein